MLAVDEHTALIGLSELRTAAPKLLKYLQTHKVILTRRNKPVGILIDYDEFKKMETLIELIEDTVLGQMAEERRKGAKKESYLSHEQMKRRVGLK
ncbi:MAG: type II toxin-antitoxin system prevent-host-death family antitoxin [Nitrospirota bacterium]